MGSLLMRIKHAKLLYLSLPHEKIHVSFPIYLLHAGTNWPPSGYIWAIISVSNYCLLTITWLWSFSFLSRVVITDTYEIGLDYGIFHGLGWYSGCVHYCHISDRVVNSYPPSTLCTCRQLAATHWVSFSVMEFKHRISDEIYTRAVLFW